MALKQLRDSVVVPVVGPAGPTGAQGPQGEKGDQGDPGDPVVWRGAWQSGEDYVELDAVSYDGSSYICVDQVTNSTTDPATDTSHWDLMAAEGEQGPQGEQGIQGPQGDKGDKGDKGDTGEGVPQGGDTGEVLAKASSTDYDTGWVDLTATYQTPDIVAHGSSGSALEVDASAGDYQTVTISAACTVTTTGWPASGKRAYVTLEVSMGTEYAVTWPSAVKWHGDEPPPLTENTRTLVVLVSRDGGTTIEGSYGPGRSTA